MSRERKYRAGREIIGRNLGGWVAANWLISVLWLLMTTDSPVCCSTVNPTVHVQRSARNVYSLLGCGV